MWNRWTGLPPPDQNEPSPTRGAAIPEPHLRATHADRAAVPPAVPAPRPAPDQPAATTPSAVGMHGGWDADPHSWRSWAATSLIVLAIRAANSLASWEFLYFWPVRVIGPCGAVLLAPTLTGRHDGPEEPRRLHWATHSTLGSGSVTV